MDREFIFLDLVRTSTMLTCIWNRPSKAVVYSAGDGEATGLIWTSALRDSTGNWFSSGLAFILAGLWQHYLLYRVAVVIAGLGLLILLYILGLPFAKEVLRIWRGWLNERWVALKQLRQQRRVVIEHRHGMPIQEGTPFVSATAHQAQVESSVQSQVNAVKRLSSFDAQEYLEQVRAFRKEMKARRKDDLDSGEGIPSHFHPMMRAVSAQLQHQIKESEVPRLEWFKLVSGINSMLPQSPFSNLLVRLGISNGAGRPTLDGSDWPVLIDETMKELEKWLAEQSHSG